MKNKSHYLRNNLPKDEALKKVHSENFKRVTLSFYRYVKITNPQEMRNKLWEEWNNLGCLGRIYLAQEGINAQMSVPEHNWDTFVSQLYARPEFNGVPFKIGINQNPDSFWKLAIKVRDQIVADGLTMDDYDITNVGNHLSAKEFNEAMEDPETVVVDMRNHYESEIGHFDGALYHEVNTFREQLPLVAEDIKDKKDKKILLYCTGGIRCEKASAYLKHKGFKDVNQLHGGVIAYKHQVEQEGLSNKFKGANYVFDGRIKEGISNEIISNCHQCAAPCDTHQNCKNKTCNLLFLQCESCKKRMGGCCTARCKKISLWPEEKQIRYYKKNGHKTKNNFSKSIERKKNLMKKSLWERILKFFK
jgi:UPF0176 protein